MKPFALTQFMVESILYLAITDDLFLRLVRNIVSPEILPGEAASHVLKVVYNFYDQSSAKLAPKDYFADEFQLALETGLVPKTAANAAREFIKKLSELEGESINKDYITKQLNNFATRQAYIDAAVEIANQARRWNLEEARDALQTALRSGFAEYESAVNYFDATNIEDRIMRRNLREDELMPFMIDPFDRRGVYLQRKFFMLIMAPEKRGKSWGGIFFGRVALLHGLNVLHLSQGDLTRRQLEDRYDMSIAGVGGSFKRDDWVHRTPVLEEHDGRKSLSKRRIKPGTIRDYSKVSKSVTATKTFGGNLLLRSFPRGSCSIKDMEALLDNLAINHNFIPDVVINDYPDIMRLPKGDYRHGINFVYEAHARIGQERNCLVIGFSQVKSKAYEKAFITMADFAEDKRKAAHCDMAFAICQTPAEETENRVRLVWVVDRHYGVSKSVAVLVQDLSLGQFCKQAYYIDDLEEGEEDDPFGEG